MEQYLLTEEAIQEIKNKWIDMTWEELYLLNREEEFFEDFERLMNHYMDLRKIEELRKMGIENDRKI